MLSNKLYIIYDTFKWIVEAIREKMSSENGSEKHSRLSYCRTDVKSKTFTSVWTLRQFWIIYKTAFSLTLITGESEQPFEIVMTINKKEEKVLFCVKSSTAVKKFICYATLQSGVTKDNYYELPCLDDNEKLIFEVNKSFLVEEGREYVFGDILKVIFKIICIDCILNRTAYTTLQYHIKKDVKDSEFSDSSKLIVFKRMDKEFSVCEKLLCAKSEYFKQMFDCDSTKNSILVCDVPQFVVQLFVNFIQYDDTSALKKVDIYAIFALFIMAKKYIVKDLLTICQTWLKEYLLFKADNLREYDSLEILRFAYDNDAEDLLKLAVDFIALSINDYINNKHFSDITLKRPKLFALLKEAKIKEVHFDP